MRAVQMLFAALMLLASVACGPLKYEIKGTPMATGADAIITADVQKEKALTLVEIAATNLPPPDRVMAGSAHFVAWQRKDNGSQWARIGVLIFDEGERKGSLTATVPELTFELQITAEREQSPESPSPDAVFFQKVN